MSNKSDQRKVDKLLDCSIDNQKLENLNYSMNLNYTLTASSAEVETLLSELKNSFNKERIDQLFDQTKKDIIFSIAGPFGLGKVIAGYDKTGGNVDTIHNVRKGIYATDKEQKAYENRGEYDSNEIHSDVNYRKVNKKHSEQQKSEGIKDAYSGGTITAKDKRNLDHTISGKQTHDDPGRVLAGIDTKDLANTDTNLNSTLEVINKSKGAKSPDEYAAYLEDTSVKRKDRIQSLKDRSNLTDKEEKELEKLEILDNVDPDEIRNAGEKAQKAQDDQINREYYFSSKFLKKSIGTSINEGAKMGAQQAFGILLVELFSSSFTEIRNSFNKGLEGASLYEDIIIRLKRIGRNVASKWKDVIKGFSGGFISGFISNLITTLINIFVTTGKRFVRMIREGVFSLLKALKLMLFPPENMTFREVSHEAMKLVGAGGVVIAGVALEEIVEKMISSIPFLAPFATIITAVIVGSLTAIVMALMTYLIDKMDLLGVIKNEQTKYMSKALDAENKEILESCEKIAEEIDSYLITA